VGKAMSFLHIFTTHDWEWFLYTTYGDDWGMVNMTLFNPHDTSMIFPASKASATAGSEISQPAVFDYRRVGDGRSVFFLAFDVVTIGNRRYCSWRRKHL